MSDNSNSIGSSSVITIKNVPKFLSPCLLKELLIKEGYKIEDLKINYITNNQMPENIIIEFKTADKANEFIKKYNNSFFTKDKYKEVSLSIENGNSGKVSVIDNEYQEFKFPVDYSHFVENALEYSKDSEGLNLIDKEMMSNFSKVVAWLIKKIGETISKGQSLMNISMPVIIFDKRSMLQTFAYELREAPYLLNQIYHIKDPLEKLKYVTVFFVAQLYHSTMFVKPFNPIIGETYQIKIGNLNIYLEQTVNKPPTADFYCFDDEKIYKFYGHISTVANTGPNSCIATKLGNVVLEFKDGYKYEFRYPNVYLGNITVGQKTFNYKNYLVVLDKISKLASYIKFNPEHKGFIKGLFSKKKEDYPDKFLGKIVNILDIELDEEGSKHTIKKDPTSFSEISGYWTKEIKFDDVTYWNRNTDNLLNFYEPKAKLKSDSTFREDINLVIQKKLEEAQTKKEEYEYLQRRDRKLRQGIPKEQILKEEKELKEKAEKKEKELKEKAEKKEKKEKEKAEKKEKKEKEKAEKKEKKEKEKAGNYPQDNNLGGLEEE